MSTQQSFRSFTDSILQEAEKALEADEDVVEEGNMHLAPFRNQVYLISTDNLGPIASSRYREQGKYRTPLEEMAEISRAGNADVVGVYEPTTGEFREPTEIESQMVAREYSFEL